jgi:hypothetical protein
VRRARVRDPGQVLSIRAFRRSAAACGRRGAQSTRPAVACGSHCAPVAPH